jgi:hypothetical protein
MVMSVEEFLADWVSATADAPATDRPSPEDVDALVVHLIASAVASGINGPELMDAVGGDLRTFVERKLTARDA